MLHERKRKSKFNFTNFTQCVGRCKQYERFCGVLLERQPLTFNKYRHRLHECIKYKFIRERCGKRESNRSRAPQSVAAWTQVQCNFFCLGANVALCVSWMNISSIVVVFLPMELLNLFMKLLNASERDEKLCFVNLIFGKLISRWMPAVMKFHFAMSKLREESKLHDGMMAWPGHARQT